MHMSLTSQPRLEREDRASVLPPFLFVAGDFKKHGGMDRANLELASYVASFGGPVSIVAHAVDETLASVPNVTVTKVVMPANSYLLGERRLQRTGMQAAKAFLRQHPDARVVVNGGNCLWGDVNWVHCVHAAWNVSDAGAPLAFRIKNRLAKLQARRREKRAFHKARLLIANSERTRQDLITLGIEPERIKRVYLGVDEAVHPPSAHEKAQARQSWGVPEGKLAVVFAGALGYDNNKGIDLLLTAWKRLRVLGDWDAHLYVAGDGRARSLWTQCASHEGIAGSITFLGHTDQLPSLLNAADLLVSPVRYEGYGLNVQEAVSHGMPAIVSATAGVAERFPEDLRRLLLSDLKDERELVRALTLWRKSPSEWRNRFEPFGEELRRNSWRIMAEKIVATVLHRGLD